MAENQNEIEEKDIPEVLEDSLSKTEVLLEENKKLISNVVMGIAAVIAGYFAINNFILEPAEQEATNAIFPLQQSFENPNFPADSVAFGYGELAVEFEDLIDNHGGTESGNTANLYLGISLMKSGDFESAQAALESFSPAGKLMPGLKVGLIGDCLSEIGEADEAVSNYKKAASLLDSKKGSCYYLKKAGILLEQNNQASEAVEVYQSAIDTYLKNADRNYASVKIEMEQYLARAQAAL